MGAVGTHRKLLGPPASSGMDSAHRCSHEAGEVLMAEAGEGQERPPGETHKGESQITGESGQRPQEVTETLVPVEGGESSKETAWLGLVCLGSAEPRTRGCSGLGEPRPALPSF